MDENGHDSAARRDLREYKLVTHDELRVLAFRQRRMRHVAEQLSARIVVEHRQVEELSVRLTTERGLLNVALHELARERQAKDPAHFIQRWLNEHQRQMEEW